jgi:hypothetical protein
MSQSGFELRNVFFRDRFLFAAEQEIPTMAAFGEAAARRLELLGWRQ